MRPIAEKAGMPWESPMGLEVRDEVIRASHQIAVQFGGVAFVRLCVIAFICEHVDNLVRHHMRGDDTGSTY
jgi:hypothetical protein